MAKIGCIGIGLRLQACIGVGIGIRKNLQTFNGICKNHQTYSGSGIRIDNTQIPLYCYWYWHEP